MPAPRHNSPGLQHLVAATSSLAVFRVGDFAIRTEASLRVAAPVDAAAGVGDFELAPRVDEHFLAPEQAAVLLGNSDVACIFGHNDFLLCALRLSRKAGLLHYLRRMNSPARSLRNRV